ncbi:MAG TPA: cytosine permease [Pseudolysinimonas sp.]|nr:cytosine permease [Pseudolysinimonas sp.]
MTVPAEASKPLIEAHSFDYVPLSERSGSIFGQFQFWFMINATLITAFTGAVGPLFGLGLSGTIVAIILGSVIGTLFQALHGAQGPRMGLPQMIQSRVQFGSRGAIVPILVATIVPLGFAIFFFQTGAASLSQITVPLDKPYSVAIGILAVLIAIFGYHLVLRLQRIASYVVLINLVLLSIAVLVVLPIGDLLTHSAWSLVGFLAQMGAAAGYQIAIAPIVSDYTRYLPKSTPSARVSAAVFGGTILSAIWIELLGASVALASPKIDVISGIAQVGNQFGFALGSITLGIAVVACLLAATASIYSGTMSFLSALEAFRPLTSGARLRAITIGIAGALIILATITLPGDILGNFSTFLVILGYLLIPWTAVNLADYYLVRRGTYSITDILRSDGGIYGRWGTRGLISYALGILVMIPFVSTGFFVGPIASAMGGADISFLVGVIVAAGSYLIVMRSYDLKAEFASVAKAEISTLHETVS